MQWVTRFRSSGLTQAQFAEQNGLKLKTLQRWLYGRGAYAATKRKPPFAAHGVGSHRIDRTHAECNVSGGHAGLTRSGVSGMVSTSSVGMPRSITQVRFARPYCCSTFFRTLSA